MVFWLRSHVHLRLMTASVRRFLCPGRWRRRCAPQSTQMLSVDSTAAQASNRSDREATTHKEVVEAVVQQVENAADVA